MGVLYFPTGFLPIRPHVVSQLFNPYVEREREMKKHNSASLEI